MKRPATAGQRLYRLRGWTTLGLLPENGLRIQNPPIPDTVAWHCSNELKPQLVPPAAPLYSAHHVPSACAPRVDSNRVANVMGIVRIILSSTSLLTVII